MKKKIRRFLRSFSKNRNGQSATEYMLVIAVVVLGLVAAASRFIPKFQEGVKKTGESVFDALSTTNTFTNAGDGN